MLYLEEAAVKSVTKKMIVNTLKSLSLFSLFFLLSCSKEIKISDLEGKWLLNLELQENELPFLLEVKRGQAKLYNASEAISLENMRVEEGEIIIPIPVYENIFYLTPNKENLKGKWVKVKQGKKESFAVSGKKIQEMNRFPEVSETDVLTSSNWKLDFYNENDELEKSAIGFFYKDGKLLKGSILTETGDYGYLEGYVKEGKMKLYGFDGQNNFIINGVASDQSLDFTIQSGKKWQRKVKGSIDPSFKLTDPETLTKLKSKNASFLVKDLDGNNFDHTKLEGRPYIIQIMGSWCPNCFDETNFLIDWFDKNPSKKVDIVPIAFERTNNRKHALYLLNRMRGSLDITYPLYLGSHDYRKQGVLMVLPFLQNHVSFPTLIFVDKENHVKKIHTGFSGPATGEAYEIFKNKFSSYLEEIL